MSACEWCWAEAQRRQMHAGGSITERYHEVLDEQRKLGLNAGCPACVRLAAALTTVRS